MREWTTIDKKAEWGPGPWVGEPDKYQWVDEATGLDCLMVRGPMGSWCGYVGVTKDHPFFEVGYGDCMAGHNPYDPRTPMDRLRDSMNAIEGKGEDPGPHRTCWDHSPESYVRVHGGLTFSGFCQEGVDESRGICHVPDPGRDPKVWWLGFDTAHLDDLIPGMLKTSREVQAKLKAENPERWKDYQRHDVYRDSHYVATEVTNLTIQLATIGEKGVPHD